MHLHQRIRIFRVFVKCDAFYLFIFFITVPVATFFEYNINANNYGKLVTMQPYVPIFKKHMYIINLCVCIYGIIIIYCYIYHAIQKSIWLNIKRGDG